MSDLRQRAIAAIHAGRSSDHANLPAWECYTCSKAADAVLSLPGLQRALATQAALDAGPHSDPRHWPVWTPEDEQRRAIDIAMWDARQALLAAALLGGAVGIRDALATKAWVQHRSDCLALMPDFDARDCSCGLNDAIHSGRAVGDGTP